MADALFQRVTVASAALAKAHLIVSPDQRVQILFSVLRRGVIIDGDAQTDEDCYCGKREERSQDGV